MTAAEISESTGNATAILSTLLTRLVKAGELAKA
jgi:hypothetical protein